IVDRHVLVTIRRLADLQKVIDLAPNIGNLIVSGDHNSQARLNWQALKRSGFEPGPQSHNRGINNQHICRKNERAPKQEKNRRMVRKHMVFRGGGAPDSDQIEFGRIWMDGAAEAMTSKRMGPGCVSRTELAPATGHCYGNVEVT